MKQCKRILIGRSLRWGKCTEIYKAPPPQISKIKTVQTTTAMPIKSLTRQKKSSKSLIFRVQLARRIILGVADSNKGQCSRRDTKSLPVRQERHTYFTSVVLLHYTLTHNQERNVLAFLSISWKAKSPSRQQSPTFFFQTKSKLLHAITHENSLLTLVQKTSAKENVT